MALANASDTSSFKFLWKPIPTVSITFAYIIKLVKWTIEEENWMINFHLQKFTCCNALLQFHTLGSLHCARSQHVNAIFNHFHTSLTR
jgi:hypothetical protein